MKESYLKCLKSIRSYRKSLNTELELKKGKLYFSWLKDKTDKIEKEDDSSYVYTKIKNETLPNYHINQYIYNKADKEIQKIINNNYTFDNKKYIFNNKNITEKEIDLLLKYIILKRGNVVWIDFGFNVGNEFGGMHPAIILKNFEKDLFVLPISSKKPLEFLKIENEFNDGKITEEECKKRKENITEIIQLDKIYGFKNITRWSNITRMKKISILRLNFSGSIGSVDGHYLNLISQNIAKEF